MPDDIRKVGAWIADNKAIAIPALLGALDLYEAISVDATEEKPPAKFISGDPIADRHIRNAYNVAAIANNRGVTPEQVLDAAHWVMRLALALAPI